MISNKDRDALRELGRRKIEAAGDPVNGKRRKLWQDLNSLRSSRPAVWINQIPWNELEPLYDDLKPVCADPFLRGIEISLRRELRQWESFPCDMTLDPFINCPIAAGPTGSYADYGIKESTVKVEGTHDVQYLPVIDSIENADTIKTPKVWHDKAESDRRAELLNSIFAGVAPVRRRGIVHQWHSPWDQLIHWYGIERLFEDMYERPELVHRSIANFCKALGEVLDEQERMGLLDSGDGNWSVGSGGIGLVDELPEVHGRPVTAKDQWGCSTAQIFSEVSPDMHYEFSLQYELPLLSRFGLSYYGCCEPLHRKFSLLRQIPNLRNISCSPKAELGKFAEEAKTDYVISWKPNPAIFVAGDFGEKAVRRQIGDALEKAKGCHLEIILKDITTVGGDPRRLEVWAKAAMESLGDF